MARYFGVPLRNGLPIGLGSVMAMGNPRGAPAPIPDPYFEYTTLLLPGNGTNGAQNNTFLDSSPNAFSITRNGNTTQGTFSPFSQTGWGNYFDGSGDYLETPSNAAFTLGSSGDFTVECWVYATATPGNYAAFMTTWADANTNYTNRWFIGVHDSKIKWFNDAGASAIADSSNIQLNTWLHVAVARSGSTITLYINGTAIGTQTTSQSYTTQGTVKLGYSGTGGAYFSGYISNARVVKGTAVYTANFTPPTAPLTAITNTSLLTCQSNRFIDNSSNAFTITRNGDVSVQAFSPFNPTAAWSAATNGGSGYFDGSGDSLTFTDSSNVLDLGGATASFECWIYAPNVSSGQGIFNKSGNTDSWNTSNGYEYNVYITGGTINFYYNNAGTGATSVSGSIVANQWTHVAVATNSSNAISLYINGTRVSTATNAITKPTTRTSMRIGNTVANEFFSGYISGLRFISGSGAYDASQTTITIPAAPPTAITNTSLLCNFTNAGIYDATSKNDLETVGNAQISTTQSKFGGSSMYFDGTGDYLASASSPLLALGTGDLTVEFWFRASSVGSNQRIVQNTVGGFDSTSYILRINGSSKLEVAFAYPDVSASSSTTIANNTWYHVALVRYGTSVRVFLNGIQEMSGTSSGNMSNQYVYVGGYYTVGNTEYFTGYVQDVRITKGIARYTSNFTPPTTAFPLL